MEEFSDQDSICYSSFEEDSLTDDRHLKLCIDLEDVFVAATQNGVER